MVAMTTTLLSSMGSRVVLPTTGILMNNGVMWFDPRPGQPNSIGPGKRPLTNMFPVILREGASPWIAAGASGGRRIMAAVLQLVSFVADFGMSPEAAAHQPRIDVSDPDKITADRRLAPDILRALEADGPLEVVEHAAAADQFRLPQSDRAGRWRANRHQRCRLALVRGGGAGLVVAVIPAKRTKRARAGIHNHDPRRRKLRSCLRVPGLATLARDDSRDYFFNTRTGVPASHCLMSSTICV